ncbi:MAG: hypothetical protein P4L31_01045, partial [Candidatus Babeliales bacterium]|nr:hypothetical protein [Candidatus Babeliales bacterium]
MYDMCPDCNQLSDTDSSSDSEDLEGFPSPETESEEGEVEEEEVHPPQSDEVCTSQFSNLSLESRQKVESILKRQKEREERRSRIAALKYLYDFTSSQLAE